MGPFWGMGSVIAPALSPLVNYENRKQTIFSINKTATTKETVTYIPSFAELLPKVEGITEYSRVVRYTVHRENPR